MKLQVAIDRVSLTKAIQLSKQLDGLVNIVELGTSIVKDYGLEALKDRRFRLKQSELLVDLKTIDEGEYEFKKGFETSADILTVMGNASRGTLEQTYKIAQERHKGIFIDLMEVDDQRINQISDFHEAIFGLHHARDSKNDFNAITQIKHFHAKFPNIKHLAVAGGINLEQARSITQQGIVEEIIVGNQITTSDNPIKMAEQFISVMR